MIARTLQCWRGPSGLIPTSFVFCNPKAHLVQENANKLHPSYESAHLWRISRYVVLAHLHLPNLVAWGTSNGILRSWLFTKMKIELVHWNTCEECAGVSIPMYPKCLIAQKSKKCMWTNSICHSYKTHPQHKFLFNASIMCACSLYFHSKSQSSSRGFETTNLDAYCYVHLANMEGNGHDDTQRAW